MGGSIYLSGKKKCLRAKLGRCTLFVTRLLCTGETFHYITLIFIHSWLLMLISFLFLHLVMLHVCVLSKIFGLLYFCKLLCMHHPSLLVMILTTNTLPEDGLCHNLTPELLPVLSHKLYEFFSRIFSSSVCSPSCPAIYFHDINGFNTVCETGTRLLTWI